MVTDKDIELNILRMASRAKNNSTQQESVMCAALNEQLELRKFLATDLTKVVFLPESWNGQG